MKAGRHTDEQARLDALRSYDILDTPPESDLDGVVRVVAAICGMPVSLISLVDEGRQWFKARTGIEVTETPLTMSVCAHGILQPDLLEIEDMTRDVRTIDNPLVAGEPRARFYAGAALTNRDGYPLGMLCVLDYQPRKLTPLQRDLLQVMAKQVMQQIELRKVAKQEREARVLVQDILDKANALLDRNTMLRQEVDHRVKNSLTQVVAFLRLQQRKHKDEPHIAQALTEAANRVLTVAKVHDHLHKVAEDDQVSVRQFLVNLAENLSENRPPQVQAIAVEADNIRLSSAQMMTLGLATNEIVTNALKHAFRPGDSGTVKIVFRQLGANADLCVFDNGGGLPDGFAIGGGQGLGLRLLGSLAQQLGGTVRHDSSGQGTSFGIRFPLEMPA